MALFKVLCIEDDDDDFEMLKELLHSVSGMSDDVYFMERAKSVALALAYAKVGNYDLFLVDHRLEGKATGGLFIRELQKDHPRAPAILITGFKSIDLETDTLKQLMSHRVAFLQKDEITRESLCRVIHEVMGRRYRVLVVDDDHEDLELVRTFLQMSPAYRFEVDGAETVDEAVGMLGERDYDGFLVDYHVGRESGIRFVQEVIRRKIDRPMLLVTGHDDIANDSEAMDLLEHDKLHFISKHNFNPERLVRMLELAGQWREKRVEQP